MAVPLASLREWWVRLDFFVPTADKVLTLTGEEVTTLIGESVRSGIPYLGTFELDGPFNYVHAEMRARDISRENESGLSELVTYEGDKLHVVSTYLRGKKRYQGQRSYQAAMYNLPPTL